MPVTPITPAQIDEVGNGATPMGSGYSGFAPSPMVSASGEYPSRGQAAMIKQLVKEFRRRDWPAMTDAGKHYAKNHMTDALRKCGFGLVALGTEARSAETGTGSVEDEGPACKATPSIPPPSPRKGQEENPCPMTVEEPSDAAIEAGCMAAWEVSRPFIAREFCGGNDPGTWSDQEEYLRAISRQEVRAAYQAIRASEEDR